jgi:hypothetical protein
MKQPEQQSGEFVLPPTIKWRCRACGAIRAAILREKESREDCLLRIAYDHMKAGCDTYELPKTHGGARKGAGRKPKGRASRVNLTVSLPPSVKWLIQVLAENEGVSASEIVRRKFAGNKRSPASAPQNSGS